MFFLQENKIHIQISDSQEQICMYEVWEDGRECLCAGKKQTFFCTWKQDTEYPQTIEDLVDRINGNLVELLN